MERRILVAGALGLIGRTLIEQCESHEDVGVIGLARRRPDFASRARFIAVDLLDPDDCRRRLADLGISRTYSTRHGSRVQLEARRSRRTPPCSGI